MGCFDVYGMILFVVLSASPKVQFSPMITPQTMNVTNGTVTSCSDSWGLQCSMGMVKEVSVMYKFEWLVDDVAIFSQTVEGMVGKVAKSQIMGSTLDALSSAGKVSQISKIN